MVIYNHSNERGFYRYSTDDINSIYFVWDYILSTLCKSGVPIFFMISGSLLLKKKEDIIATFERIPRILIDLILFSLLYYWIDNNLAGNTFSLKNTVITVIQNTYWHLWYLYAYIALILTVPFLRKMVKSFNVKDFLYLFVLAVVLQGLLPIIEYFSIEINMQLKPSWVIDSIFIFPVMGYAADRVLDIKKVKTIHLIELWILNFFCMIIGYAMEYFYLSKEPGNTDETFLRLFWIVNSVILFVTVKKLLVLKQCGAISYKLVTECGKCTYGIYLLHIWFLWKIPCFNCIWMQIENGAIIPERIGIILTSLFVFIIAGVCTYALRYVPIVQRLL